MIPRDKIKSLGKLEMSWKLGADEGGLSGHRHVKTGYGSE